MRTVLKNINFIKLVSILVIVLTITFPISKSQSFSYILNTNGIIGTWDESGNDDHHFKDPVALDFNDKSF